MPVYDANRFSPPAPVAEVTLRNPEKGVVVSGVFMLIDSGADVTILPKSVVDSLDVAGERGNCQAMGFDGSIGAYETVHAELTFSGKRFKGQFMVLDDPTGVIGRNILNHVSLVLDGPNFNWEVK